MAENEEPTPKIVQVAGQGQKAESDEKVTPSARSEFWASTGVGHPEGDGTASRDEQVKAFEEYSGRPDIESRESILARENAAPGQFSEENVRSGSVDDGKVEGGEKSAEAEKEAETV